jgi:hypothetical protein
MDRSIMIVQDKFTNNKVQIKIVTYLGVSIHLIGSA